jgi:hypothetical protein
MGAAGKLLFEIETVKPDGTLHREVERMWVITTERVDDLYIGRLDNMPDSVESAPHVYLSEGAEIPFGPEHVTEVELPQEPWADYVAQLDGSRRWPRDSDSPGRQAAR